MVLICFTVFVHIIMSATSIDLKGLIPAHKVGKCVVGTVVENKCISCVCKSDHYYHCQRTPCDHDEDNVLLVLGKPTQAICQPRMAYIHNSTTCICSKYGYWPHDKCEILFKSLYKKSHVLSLKCEPKSYVVIGCNVCKCGPNGLVDKKHCTKNDCNEIQVKRRTIDNVHGSCQPSNWYSLAPCQFCYCVHENKLVCSTGNNNQKMLELGAYNLTVCGKELLKEVVELIPDGLKALRDGDKTSTTQKTTITTPTATPSIYRTSVMTSSRNYEPELNIQNVSFKFNTQLLKSGEPVALDYDTSEEVKYNNETALVTRDGSTMLPYEGSENDESNDNEDDETEQASGFSYQSLYEPQSMPTQAVTSESPVIAQAPDVTTPANSEEDPKITNTENKVVRIHLPSVLDQLLQMALRKSMVKLEPSTTKCTPGATTQNNCNMCYCLTNGKLLCTVKECST